MNRILRVLFVLILIACVWLFVRRAPATKSAHPSVGSPPVKATAPPAVQFTDITAQAGIRFVHNHGGFGNKYLPESMGSGCAFLDYNNDGWSDIFLVNSMDWPGRKKQDSYPALYRNNKDGTFTDVTREAGLAVEMYGLGVSAADYDNDGDTDIFVTCLESDRLFRNRGNGAFEDATAEAGLADTDFGSSSTWLDYDRDGQLDLFVCNYVQWSIEKDLHCTLDGVNKSYCTPESYEGASPRLYRNLGNSKFEDVSKQAGVYDPASKALGVIAFDYDVDGFADLFVANDTQPNRLYRNRGNGTFEETGMTAGVAFSEAGVARAGMGVDASDYDNSGRPGLVIGNFSNEMIGLYHNEGSGLFIDEAPASTVGQQSLLTLTFSAFFFDYDLDGLPDIFAANGHVHDDIQKVQPQVTYAQPPHLFRNLGGKRFQEVTEASGDLKAPAVARGAAYGDIDNDGDLDVLVSTNDGPARLFRNDGGETNHSLRIRVRGSRSNRDGIGTRVVAHLSDGSRRLQEVKAAAGYCSQNEPVLTFGLGAEKRADRIVAFWPSGARSEIAGPEAGRILELVEP